MPVYCRAKIVHSFELKQSNRNKLSTFYDAIECMNNEFEFMHMQSLAKRRKRLFLDEIHQLRADWHRWYVFDVVSRMNFDCKFENEQLDTFRLSLLCNSI